jgi:hypothetical protein
MRGMEEIMAIAGKYLNKHNVQYVIVGGIAVLAYGTPRTTMDADIIIQMDTKELKTFAEFLARNGFFSKSLDIEDAFREKSHFSAFDKDSLFRLDIKGVYNEMDERTLKNRRAINYRGMKLYLESPEDIIANKLVFGSEQDIKDADGIYMRQLPKLDMRYLEKACATNGVMRDFRRLQRRINKYMKESVKSRRDE